MAENLFNIVPEKIILVTSPESMSLSLFITQAAGPAWFHADDTATHWVSCLKHRQLSFLAAGCFKFSINILPKCILY